MRSFYNDDAHAAAVSVTDAAIEEFLQGDAKIKLATDSYSVTIVAAPAGAGKSYFVGSVAEAALDARPDKAAVIAVVSPTNAQAHALVEDFARRMPDREITFLPSTKGALPAHIASLRNVNEVKSKDVGPQAIVIGTLAKFGDAISRGDLSVKFDFLCIDEAYQADSAAYFRIAGVAPRHLLVGDPGQLSPFSTAPDADRWKGLAEDPTQTAVAVVCRNHPSIKLFRLPITRRLPNEALPIVRSFYPDHHFESWVSPGARRLRIDVPSSGDVIDEAIDMAASSGWSYVRLPGTPVLTADPATINTVAQLVRRLHERDIHTSCERTKGTWQPLLRDRIAIAVSHNDQKDFLRAALDDMGLSDVRVDTANRLQGLEFDVLIAWHPLAGLPDADGFHLDPGRLCVMLTRHRHACIVVGRASDYQLIDRVPPPSDAWAGDDSDPEVDGWYAHKLVFEHLNKHAVDVLP